MGRRIAEEDELARYRVGARVRQLRLRKKISLEDLGRHTSLSPGLLSKLERGRVTPTLPTLLRIAAVFGIGLQDFFVREPQHATVVRVADRLRFPESQDAHCPAYHFEGLNYLAEHRALDAYLAFFTEGPAPVSRHAHGAPEFLHVLSGTLAVCVEDEQWELQPGDSMYISGGALHGYARIGSEVCRALVVVSADSRP